MWRDPTIRSKFYTTRVTTHMTLARKRHTKPRGDQQGLPCCSHPMRSLVNPVEWVTREPHRRVTKEKGIIGEPQRIPPKDRHVPSSKNQSRRPTAHPAGTSKHGRFARLLGQKGGRIAKPKMAAPKDAGPTKYRHEGASSKSSELHSAELVNVPIKLLQSPPSKISTPMKRKSGGPIQIPNRHLQANKRTQTKTTAAGTATIDLSSSGFFQVR